MNVRHRGGKEWVKDTHANRTHQASRVKPDTMLNKIAVFLVLALALAASGVAAGRSPPRKQPPPAARRDRTTTPTCWQRSDASEVMNEMNSDTHSCTASLASLAIFSF